MFRSTSFIFDGIPSEDYGVMIYFLDDSDTREAEYGTNVEVIEDRLPKRVSPINYGVDMNRPMSFPLTFGSLDYMEDYDVDAILSWLTGHQQYKWLEFVDGDHYVRYKCHLNNMNTVYINGLPTAFTCDVECDGQFAYEYPIESVYEIDENELELDFLNKSSYNGYFYPKLKIEFDDNCSDLTIINDSDNGREFKINQFDRSVIDSSKSELVYDTTIAQEASKSEAGGDFLSWQVKVLPTEDKYGSIIEGNGVLVCLPLSGSTALYSEDNGATWNPTALPHSGSWTGCYGENGFVAICTDSDSDIASYSQTGKEWNVNPIELPIKQAWRKVAFVETEGFAPNQYIAIGGVDSNIAAISMSGWSWQLLSLPVAQTWNSIVAGNNKVFIIGGTSNIALETTDCILWREVTLPKTGAWTDGCYGTNGFVLVCDSLQGSGAQEPISLISADGETWKVLELPIGPWKSVSYGSSGYIAVGANQFAHSLNLGAWEVNTLPASVKSVATINGSHVCMLGDNKYITSDASSTIKGSFDVDVPVGEGFVASNIYVNGFIDATVDDSSYTTNGQQLLATNLEGDPENGIEPEVTGGNLVSLTTDLRYGLGIDGIRVSAIYNPDEQIVSASYIADMNHTTAINAPMAITVSYQANATTDLGYDGLVVNFDNENQIITCNKENLNMYEHFNFKFMRLVKGQNKLRLKTTGGGCKVTFYCEFLRKVGGR